MAESKCRAEDCEAHSYMVITMNELKEMDKKLVENQQALCIASARLTENFAELQRTNERLDALFKHQREKDEQQDALISEQVSFTNKAVGVLSALTFLVPIGLFLLGIFIKS